MKCFSIFGLAALVCLVAAQQGGSPSIPAPRINPGPAQQTKGQKDPEGPESMIGKPAIFTMTGIDQKIYTNETLKGKVLLIDFWATWCGPCKMASPVLDEVSKEFADKGVVVIGANTSQRDKDGNPDMSPDNAIGYQREHGYTYTFTFGTDAIKNAWHVHGIPTFFLIDKKGVFRDVVVGYSDDLKKTLESKLKKLLK